MRLGVVGTGMMAPAHAKAFSALDGVTLAAAIDIDKAAAGRFANEFQFEAAYGSLAEAALSAGLDAVAIVTPDKTHHPITMEALEAGLHVFCEKPLATQHSHAEEMCVAAEAAGVVHGVNLTYRNVPALQKARAMIEAGEIGAVRHFQAAYLQSWLTQNAWGDWRSDPTWLWRLSERHGSLGVLGDVGIHVLDFATFAIGSSVATVSARHKVFDKSETGQIGDYTLDANDSVAMILELKDGAMGVVHASRFASGHLNELRLRIYGDKGGLEVTNNGEMGTLRVSSGGDLNTGDWREVPLVPVPTTYERFVDAVMTGGQMDPNFYQGARLQKVLDLAYAVGGTEGVRI